jgi:hypothetical protein
MASNRWSSAYPGSAPGGHSPGRPNGQWKGGEFERIEAKNRAMLRARFAKQANECLIQPYHPSVNIVGGYRFPAAPAVDLSPVKPTSFKSAPLEITGDGLDIPEFLRRTVAGGASCDDVIASSAMPWQLRGTGCAREICGAGAPKRHLAAICYATVTAPLKSHAVGSPSPGRHL